MTDELADKEAERHMREMAWLRGFPGSRPLPEHSEVYSRGVPGREPENLDAAAEDLLEDGYRLVELDGGILHDVKIIADPVTHEPRLFVYVTWPDEPDEDEVPAIEDQRDAA